MSASDSLIIANCNTLAETARSLADDNAILAALDGEDISERGAAMCLNLIAETCQMLAMLNDWNIDIEDFFIDAPLLALNAIVKRAKATKTED